MRYLKFICFALFLSMTSVTYAQKDTILHKEVEVTKAYQPIIRDAQKISIIPANNDTVTTKPTFGYSIQSKPGQLARTPTSIAAANLANESETRSGLGYLKAGLGNYLTSYAELFLNKPQSENTAFGMHFKHLASGGDIKLANGSNVDAPFSQNGISMFAKQFFQSSALSFDLGYNRDRITYYGLPDFQNLTYSEYYDRKQVFQKAWLGASYKINPSTEGQPAYDFKLNYHYFTARSGQKENFLSFQGDYIPTIQWFKLDLQGGVDYLRTNNLIFINDQDLFNNTLSYRQLILVHFNPTFLFEGDQGKARIGMKSTINIDNTQDSKCYVSPNVQLDWYPIEKYLGLYAGADGDFNPNTLASMSELYPYKNTFEPISPTIEQYRFYGGIQGQISDKFAYRTEISHAWVEGLPSFYFNVIKLSGSNPMFYCDNRYHNDWIKTKDTRLTGEFSYTGGDQLSLHLNAIYHDYSERPMGVPLLETNLSANYKFDDRLSFDMHLHVEGERKFMMRYISETIWTDGLIHYNDNPDHLDIYTFRPTPVVDLGIGGRYQFKPKLSFWGRVNNLLSRTQELWFGYPEQRINILLGAAYSF